MIDLQLLGGLALPPTDRASDGAVAHRHPLALLALIAAAAPEPIARNRVMALLWPESDAARASNSLRQILFRLRRALGEDLLLPETTAGLRLDPRVVRVDLWAFREALERDALEEAVRVYRGPFLDGFSLPRAAELAHWVERERDRLARQHLTALDALARRAGAAGRHAEAVAWRQRQAAADPFSSRAALALLEALVAAGDRPGALEQARTYETAVRLHLEIEPDPAVMEFVAALRPPPPRGEDPPALTAEAPRRAPVPAPRQPPVRRDRRARRATAAAAAVVLALFLGFSMTQLRTGLTYGAWRPHATGCFRDVPEAERYALVYALPIPANADYQDGLPPYSVDRSGTLGAFDRVAYCLQLDEDWVWVSMDAFTTDPRQLGVPVAATGATFQQTVSDMNVFSNVAGVVTGTGIATGNIEFWHQCYDEATALGLPGASGTRNDFDDVFPHARYRADSCYGSMQVHDYGAGQTVFAYNQWDRNPGFDTGPDDLGIGSSSAGPNPDWSFASNADRYHVRTLHVLARTVESPRPTPE